MYFWILGDDVGAREGERSTGGGGGGERYGNKVRLWRESHLHIWRHVSCVQMFGGLSACGYICFCICVCICACMYTYMCVSMYANSRHGDLYVCMCACVYICICVCVHICVRMHVCPYVHVGAQMKVLGYEGVDP